MKNVTIKTFTYFATHNQSCFDIIDRLLKDVDCFNDKEVLKSNNALELLFDTLASEGYFMGFTKEALPGFEKDLLVYISTEYRTLKMGQKFGWEPLSIEQWISNRSCSGLPLT